VRTRQLQSEERAKPLSLKYKGFFRVTTPRSGSAFAGAAGIAGAFTAY
jgi:hypothetical protein